MKKTVSNKQVGQFIEDVADQLRHEITVDFNIAQTLMDAAEKELVQSLDEKQLQLYNIFCDKRANFYAVAQQRYHKKF